MAKKTGSTQQTKIAKALELNDINRIQADYVKRMKGIPIEDPESPEELVQRLQQDESLGLEGNLQQHGRGHGEVHPATSKDPSITGVDKRTSIDASVNPKADPEKPGMDPQNRPSPAPAATPGPAPASTPRFTPKGA